MIATLPDSLAAAIEHEISATPGAQIRDAAQSLSTAYRNRAGIPRTLSPAERAAYLAVRFPSTFAVAHTVWNAFAQTHNVNNIASIVDLGAGPGTASLAAASVLPQQATFTLVERDAGWRPVAERLAKAALIEASFHTAELTSLPAKHDLVLASYALGELPQAERESLTKSLWAHANKALIVIEPGTPKGFEHIRQIREQTLALGAHAAAPCTHDQACPMSATDWCHQPVRVARAAAHRAAKQAPLAYEDEKYSFVIMTRQPPRRSATARIVRKPMRNAGHVHLDLCSDGKLSRTTIGKSAGATYRQARDAEWGEAWPPLED